MDNFSLKNGKVISSYAEEGEGATGWNAKGGAGGTIKISEYAQIYVYNENKYTDGTTYDEGMNQL